jgi:hypothetical protein
MPDQEPQSASEPSPGRESKGAPASVVDLMPFARTLGVHFDHAGKDEVRARLDWAPFD